MYPHCLRFLDLLQSEEVRKLLTDDRGYKVTLGDQQFYHWLYRRRHTHTALAGARGAAGGRRCSAGRRVPGAGAGRVTPFAAR